MITEDYVSLEIAKLLNTKGFKGEFHKHYWGYELGKEFLTNSSFNPEYDYPAPTLQTVMKWLREVYKLDIDISIEYIPKVKYIPKKVYYYSILKKTVIRDIDCMDSKTNFKSYEEAAETAIKYCLENLILLLQLTNCGYSRKDYEDSKVLKIRGLRAGPLLQKHKEELRAEAKKKVTECRKKRNLGYE